MTETEWLNSDDPYGLLDFLGSRVTERQMRLFACAALRRVWGLICHGVVPNEVELVERYVDGTANRGDLWLARARLGPRGGDSLAALINRALHGLLEERPENVVEAVDGASQLLYHFLMQQSHPFGQLADRPMVVTGAEVRRQADFLRDIVGNPFRPAPSLGWRTETVAAVARGIYAAQAFDRLPILADALEDAGCDWPEVLAHCRRPGVHVRGCWVVDLLRDGG